jgi:DNA-binding transcriptional LysR family regulator
MALFVRVVKEGSFTVVGHQQGLAISVISTAISQLEADLGVRLLHRSTRKLTLTEAGQVFLRRCEAMLFEAESAYEEVQQLTGKLTGLLTITASLFEAQHWVLPALEPLLQANPKLRLNMLISNYQMDMVVNSIDIAIRAGGLTDSTLIARPLMTFPEVLVAAPKYLQTHNLPKSLLELSEHKMIAFLPFNQPQKLTLIDSIGKTHSVQLSVGAKTDSVEIAHQLVLMGAGLARLPRDLVMEDLKQGRLVELLPDYTFAPIKLYAVTLKRDLQPPKVGAALTALQAFMQ